MKLERLVVHTLPMVRPRCSTGLGISITGSVGFIRVHGHPLMKTTFTGLQEDREAATTADYSGSAIRFTGSVESS